MEEYLLTIQNEEHRARMREVLVWTKDTFPSLQYAVKWNQPVFTDHGTYIIGFSASKKHFSVSPEQAGMEKFKDEIAEAGYSQTENLFRIGWDKPVDYELLRRMIAFNIEDKAEHTKFWRS